MANYNFNTAFNDNFDRFTASERTFPKLYLEAAFGQTVDTATLVWTDISEYVRMRDGIRFTHGTAQSGASPTAGQLQVTLDNNDARFTPGNETSPYGLMTVQCPIRVRALYNSLDTTMWTGFVTDWQWQKQDTDYVVQVHAADILALAGKIEALGWIEAHQLNLPAAYGPEPSHFTYWPLSDPAGSDYASPGRTSVEYVNPRGGLAFNGVGGNLAFGVPDDLSPDPLETVAAFTPASDTDFTYIHGPATADGSGSFAISCFLHPIDAEDRGVWGVLADEGAVIAMERTSDGRIKIYADGETSLHGDPNSIPLNQWSWVYVQRSTAGGSARDDRVKVFIDSTTQSSATDIQPAYFHTVALKAFERIDLTVGFIGVGADTVKPWNGRLAHYAAWGHENTAVWFLDWIRDVGDTGATAQERWEALATLTRGGQAMTAWIQASSRADVIMGPVPTRGRPLIQVCQDVARTEFGRIVALPDGRLWLQGADYSYNPEPAITVSSEGALMAIESGFGLDDSRRGHEARVNNAVTGTTATATAGDLFGADTISATIYAASDLQAEGVAQYIVRGATTDPRSPTINISIPAAIETGDDIQPLLDLLIGEMVEVTDLPTQAPSATFSAIVESIEHEITANQWTLTLDTSSAQNLTAAVLDVSQLDVNATLLI